MSALTLWISGLILGNALTLSPRGLPSTRRTTYLLRLESPRGFMSLRSPNGTACRTGLEPRQILIESKPLSTELETMPSQEAVDTTETLTPEALHEANGPVTDPVDNPAVGANHLVTPAPEVESQMSAEVD